MNAAASGTQKNAIGASADSGSSRGATLASRVGGFAAQYSLAILLVALIVIFSIAEPKTFATVANFKSILSQNSVLGILAIGALLPLIVGQFDLSVGANLGIASILCTGLAAKSGLPAGLAIGLAIAASLLVGFVNGALVSWVKIDAFVTTLGMSSLLAGAAVWYTNGQAIAENIPDALTKIGQTEVAGIPTPVLFLAVVVVIFWYLVQATPFGRYLYAVGGSREAARLSGLNAERLTLLAFLGAGLLAGIAGVLQAGELGSGDPLGGPPFLLPAFAAVFLGATSFRSGTFNVTGTVVAVFTIAVGINGLEAIGAPSYVEPVFTGSALILSAIASRSLNRHRR